MNKRTRNIISGVMVGAASIYAVVNFSDIPADDVKDFALSTLLFFVGIVLLALVAVAGFKLLQWLEGALAGALEGEVKEEMERKAHETTDADTGSAGSEQGQDTADRE